jgi:hypothetical protein
VKRPLSAVRLSCLFLALSVSAGAADSKVNSADYPLAVHISASTYATSVQTAASMLSEVVTATVDGKHYQLQGPTSGAKIYTHGNGLMNPGDYHARLSMDQHKTSYESEQQFEILFPDGTVRKFLVVGQSE